jgi:TonB family protein
MVSDIPAIELVIPKLEELPEVELVYGAAERTEAAEVRFDLVTAPQQIDLPTMAAPTDFVQQVDFSTLIDRSSIVQGTAIMIPGEVVRKAMPPGKTIFNLAELDRRPEVVFQPTVPYPTELRQAGQSASLMVEFVVDDRGNPRDAVVVASTNTAFDLAATRGVLRWRFRAGMKNGRRVNTRMRVPIEFQMVE